MFIFLLQSIWLYISELAGREIDGFVILKLLGFVSPKLIPLVLPLTILVTSIMTFGSFAENYEFAAMKSSGISLQRAMRGLIVFITILSITAFFFANNVIPRAEFEFVNLRKNIAKLKPAAAISEGMFNEIGDINIKVEEKSGDNEQYLSNVIIHKKNPAKAGNYTVMKAKEGELISSEGSDVLSLVLKDGNYYDEIQPKQPKEIQKRPFAKSYFKEYTINVDLSEMNQVDMEDRNYTGGSNMLKISELQTTLDSVSETYNKNQDILKRDINTRSGLKSFVEFEPTKDKEDKLEQTKETVLEHYEIDGKLQVVNLASGNINNVKNLMKSRANGMKDIERKLNKYEMALHEKYVLAVACFILFFVGAPLGAIIRKGGLGLPMVIAILLFLTYHFIGIFAKNSAEESTLSPFIGTWLSTFIMLPLGVYFTYRATTDQGLFSFSSLFHPIGKFFKRLFNIKDKDDEVIFENLNNDSGIPQQERETLRTYDNDKLIDIAKNYQLYNYEKGQRLEALTILNERGVTQEILQQNGELYNPKIVEVVKHFKRMKAVKGGLLVSWLLVLINPILLSVLGKTSEGLFITCLIVTVLSLIVFYILVFRIQHSAKVIESKSDKTFAYNIFIAYILGFLVFPIVYFIYLKEVKQAFPFLKTES